jgi:hypothetical protein
MNGQYSFVVGKVVFDHVRRPSPHAVVLAHMAALAHELDRKHRRIGLGVVGCAASISGDFCVVELGEVLIR